MIKLDDRLAAIASLVRLDRRICDVGTDHALLPCYLAQNGALNITASDVNPNPLAAARANVEKYGCADSVGLVLSDGLKSVPPCDDVIIAGMGPNTILIHIRKKLQRFQRNSSLPKPVPLPLRI